MLGFRVWDSIDKRFLTTIEERRKITVFDDGMLSLCTHEPLSEQDLCRYIPMQSTGLKDCNYVEIFEGDIFRWEGGCIYTVKDIIKFIQDTTSWDGIENRVFTVVSVIGNIYENPELIKQEK